MKRYLVTTAHELTWPRDRPLLFLGDWCMRPDRRPEWDGLDYVVAAPLNRSSAERKKAVANVRTIAERLLPELVDGLNRYHSVVHGIRYWQILIGHWLQRWVSTAYNRYLTMQRALECFEIDGTTLLRPRSYSLATQDSLAYIWAVNDDLWNHVLGVELLSYLGAEISEQVIVDIDTEPCFCDPRPALSSSSLARRILRNMATSVLPYLSRESDAVIVGSYLPFAVEARLNLALRQMPQLWRTPTIQFPLPSDRSALRHALQFSGERNLEGFVKELLPLALPSCFVEGYPTLTAESESLLWPSKPRFIFTSNNFDTDEVFKAWVAQKSEKGVPYFVGQHGNNYGTHFYFGGRCWPERSAVDSFLTWGWEDGQPDVTAAFNFKSASKMPKLNPAGGVLLIETCVAHNLLPWDVASEHLDYLVEQFNFVSSLPQYIRKELTVRLPGGFDRFPCCEFRQWADCHPDVAIDDGITPFKSLLSRSRLVVFSYDSTGILEMLAANRPVICFWLDKWGHLDESTIPYYELLQQVGIFQESAESAAKMVAGVWEDVSGWWCGMEVQRARNIFCERYSRKSAAPARELAELLDQSLRLSRQSD